MANPLKIGATFPNFYVQTTKGDFMLHDWFKGDPAKPWTVFFSHPKDFTPVCTTELGACHKLSDKFAQLGAKLIGVSCDGVDDHKNWSKDILYREGRANETSLSFPIIADGNRSIVTQLGMLDPEEKDAKGVPLPARALVILEGTTVKLTILYPATTGRNFDEVLRVLTSLQLTAGEGLATPVDWKYGERVIVGPPVKTEDAKAKFTGFQMEALPSGKPYLRSVDCPAKGRVDPMKTTAAPVSTYVTPTPVSALPMVQTIAPGPTMSAPKPAATSTILAAQYTVAPAVTNAAPATPAQYGTVAPAVTYAAPATPAQYATVAPAVTYAAPATPAQYGTVAPAVTYAATAAPAQYGTVAPAVTYAATAAPAPTSIYTAPNASTITSHVVGTQVRTVRA